MNGKQQKGKKKEKGCASSPVLNLRATEGKEKQKVRYFPKKRSIKWDQEAY